VIGLVLTAVLVQGAAGPLDEADWTRWLAVRDDAAARATLLDDAARAGRSSLLEAIAVHSGLGAQQALAHLVAADDPRWPRTATWLVQRRDSHTSQAAHKALSERPELAAEWGTGERYLPALTAAEVLAPLAADSGATPPAVVRAIEAFALLDEHAAPWSNRLLARVRDADATVARAAGLAYAHHRASEVPFDALLVVVAEARAPATVREAALIGASHGPHTVAWSALLAIAEDPAHPAWRAAVARLGDLDEGFAPVHLADLGARLAGTGDGAFLARELDRVRRRFASNAVDTRLRRLRPLLERAAWADLNCAPIERTLVPWTLGTLTSWSAEPEVHAALARLRDGYAPRPELARTTLFGDLGARVRTYATGLTAQDRDR
jgi:hypothetical protein